MANPDLGGDCLICSKPVPDFSPQYCCSGHECGCRGMPMEPCVCSDACANALYAGVGKPYEQRRLDAGIPLWVPHAG